MYTLYYYKKCTVVNNFDGASLSILTYEHPSGFGSALFAGEFSICSQRLGITAFSWDIG